MIEIQSIVLTIQQTVEMMGLEGMEPYLTPLLVGAIGTALVTIFLKFHFVLLGTLYGMTLGALPGMGGTVTLALLAPLTIVLEPIDAFILLAAAWGGTTYAGSITAIIINTPGTGSNAATLIDGYPLTRQNLAGYALGASAMASASGAVIAIVFFIALIPVVSDIVLLFGTPEYFWLILIGIAVIPMVAGDNMMGGLVAAGFGILLSLVGMALATGEARFTMGRPILLDGLDFIAVLIGLFAIAEILRLASTKEPIVGGDTESEDNPSDLTPELDKMDGVKEVIRRPSLLVRSSLIGLLVGIVPGVGGVSAAFIAYAQAQETSAEPEKFGNGSIEGVIAPEGANDAKDGGQLFPTLGLGIPGSASAAVIIGAFFMHGIVPDTRMLVEQRSLVLAIAFALLFSNVMTSIIGLGLVDHIVWALKRAKIGFVFPAILVLSVVGTFTIRNNLFDVLTAMVFGVIGFYLLIVSVSRVPMLIAFILGIMAEDNYFIALQINRWSYREAFFTGWLSLTLFGLLLATLSVPAYRLLKEYLIDGMIGESGRERPVDEAQDHTVSETKSVKIYSSFVIVSAALLALVQYDISIRGYNRFETIAFAQTVILIAAIALALNIIVLYTTYKSESTRIWIDGSLYTKIMGDKPFTLFHIGLLFVYYFAIESVGFFISSFVLCLAYSYWMERNAIYSLIFSSLLITAVYYLMIEFLQAVRILSVGEFDFFADLLGEFWDVVPLILGFAV